ncbi:MAG: hypothetical protein MNPFHGCM_02213 [Gemmatimonadaceae bacterium]|nr:hypothetical protein [Gemmatimonadaceae bacterium]
MTSTSIPMDIASRPWSVDASHTNVGFSVRHLMISTVRGRFAQVEGSAVYDPTKPGSLGLRVSLPVDSISTHNEQRDTHLKSADFFDAAGHPEITFVGKRVEGDVGGKFKLIGDLTIRGITKEFVLNVSSEGAGSDPWGNERLGFSATGSLNRMDYGLTWNAALETGGVVVGDEVKVTVDVELLRAKE